jgi:FtsH-binding integral membrane protein
VEFTEHTWDFQLRDHRGRLAVTELFYNIAAMNALFASMAWCAARPNRWSILTVLTFALIWPFVNGMLEGNLLFTLSSTHGITSSDLLSVLAAVIALFQTMRTRRAAHRNQPATEHSDDITDKL